MAKAKKQAESSPQSALPHPKLSEQLIGQEAAFAHLVTRFESGKMPHAWLISGQKGTGKATLAYALAKYVLANRAENHAAIQRILHNSHTDLLVLENQDSKDISVEEARQIPAFLSHTAAEGEWRIVIIDSVDSMNRQAANAMLKTLEEPPAKTLLLLISHNPGLLLPTIRSRCRMLTLARLTLADFNAILLPLFPSLQQDTMQHYFTLSDGSPGIAAFLLEQEALALYHAFLELFLSGRINWIKAHALADQLGNKQNAERLEAVQHILYYFLRQIIRARTGEKIEEVLDGESSVLHHLAKQHSLDSWLDVWRQAGNLLRDIRRIHLDPKQVLLNIFAIIA